MPELQRDRTQARRPQQLRFDALDHAGGAGTGPHHRGHRGREEQRRVSVGAEHQLDDLVARAGR